MDEFIEATIKDVRRNAKKYLGWDKGLLLDTFLDRTRDELIFWVETFNRRMGR